METDHLKHYPEISGGIHRACLAVPPMTADEFAELCDDIEKNGLSQPIILTPEKELLDGRNRLRACYERMVEAKFKTTTVDPWIYTISANIKRRHLTVGQICVFGLELLEEEKEKARERQGHGQTAPGQTLSVSLDEAFAGKATEVVAAKLGVSASSLSKAAKVREFLPDLLPKIASNEITLEAAYKEARKHERQLKQHPVPDTPKTTTKPQTTPANPAPQNGTSNKTVTQQPTEPVASKPAETPAATVPPAKPTVQIVTVDGKVADLNEPQNVRFNKTTDAVDWARWTWNPVTGCNHGCSFCYAREIANMPKMEPFYPFKFEPTFHEYRLSAPKNTPVPQSDDPRDQRVFVCSMADLFGSWVPEEWIQKVFDACLEAPDWEYLFLTKWPAKYSRMPLLERAWYGASVVSQKDVERVESSMQNFEAPNVVKWVSMEPMLGPVRFNDLSWCDLVVIGSQTQTNQPDGFSPAVPADFDEVVDVVNQCREWGVPYYLKANLGLQQPGMKLPHGQPRKQKG